MKDEVCVCDSTEWIVQIHDGGRTVVHEEIWDANYADEETGKDAYRRHEKLVKHLAEWQITVTCPRCHGGILITSTGRNYIRRGQYA